MSSKEATTVEEDEIDLKELFKVIMQYKWSIIFTTLIVTALAAVYVKTLPNVYKTNATIEVNDKKQSIGGANALMALALGGGGGSSNSGADIALLKSRLTLDAVLDSVDIATRTFAIDGVLNKIEYYKDRPIRVEVINKSPYIDRYSIKIELKSDNSFDMELLTKSSTLATGSKSKKFIGYKFNQVIKADNFTFKVIKEAPILKYKNYEIVNVSKELMIEDLADKNIKIDSDKDNPNILILSYEDTIKQRAKDFLNELIKVYLKEKVKRKTDEYMLAFKSIDNQLKIAHNKLQDAENKMQKFQESKNSIDIKEETIQIAKTLAEYDSKLMLLNMKIDIIKKLVNSIKNGKNLETLTIAGSGIEDPNIAKLIGTLQDAMLKRKAMLKEFTPAYPEVQQLASKIAQLKRMIYASFNNTLKIMNSTKEALEKSMKKYQGEVANLPKKQFSYIDIRRKVEFNEKYYAYLLKKKSEFELQQLMSIGKNRVLDKPYSLVKPIKPKRKLIIIVAFITGLILSIFIAFFRAFLNNKIVSINDIKKSTLVPVVATIGHIPKKYLSETIAFDSSNSIVADSFRRLRTALRYKIKDKSSSVVAVTSTVNSEGKSVIASNLATIISLTSKRVVVVDLNLRKPSLHEKFKLSNSKGVATLLASEENISNVLQHTTHSNLDLIAAGSTALNPAELMESSKFSDIVDELKDMYDVVIFVTPSISLAPECRTILDVCDVTLYLFREGYSNSEFVNSLNKLKEDGIKELAVVYNDTKDKDVINLYI